MYKWTDEQNRAITAFGSPIIVSAAAGSGKTAVLVERTVRLLADEKLSIPADTLLAVTFTNDAAAQMSRKLAAGIDDLASENPDSLWIQRQQALLRLAEITTINSFCFGLVRDNLSLTDFQSGIRIIEENEASMLSDRALTEVLENEYASDPEGMEELISLFCKENDASLRRLILQLYRFLRTLPFPEFWVKNALRSLRDGSAAKSVKSARKSKTAETLTLIETAIYRLFGLCDALDYHSAAKAVLLDNCRAALEAVENIKSSPEEKISEIALNISFRPLTVRQTKAEKEAGSEIEAAFYESAKELNAHIKELFRELAETAAFTDDDINRDSEEVSKYFERLYDLTKKLDSEVMKMKIERNAIDFSDAELMCVKLLVNCSDRGELSRTPLCEEIVNSRRYRVILIDEFQDVNNLQEVIFKAISDTDNLEEIGKNVFAVGDVKQAIYRFRQANPKIFMRTREQGKDPKSPVVELLLRKNFRSRASVLSFCNYVFGALMSKEIGETDYTDEETLYPGSDYIPPDSPTEIIAVDGDLGDVSEIEFTAAARKIRMMINDGVQVTDGEGLRPCRPSDFCVLTRTNVSGSQVKEIFAAEGLKILTSETSGYLKSREISLLLNLLAITVSPMQDVPLASVMLSPIMGFSDDDLAQIRIISRTDKLYKTVLRISEGDNPENPALTEKCREAVSLIKRLSVYASGLTLSKLIRKIYDATDIFSVASAYEDAEQKCANLYLLLEYARAYEQSGGDGVSGFLRYIGYISKSGGDFEQALTVTESADAVNVKTIHRSKGLEYPFVIICQTGRQFNRSDLNGAMQLSAERGVGLKFLDYETLTKRSTVYWDYVREGSLSELLSEELRLLYVAMTRAKERLIIILDLGESAIKRAESFSYEINSYKIPPSVSSRATCSADWLICALVKHPGFTALRSRLDGGVYSDSENLPEITVSAIPESSYLAEEEINSENPVDEDLAERLIKSFSEDTKTRLTENEAKLTVSEIVKDDALNFFPQVPSLDESLEEFSAARIGTITHRFMQYCDFSSASEDLESEITRLTKSGLFTSHEASVIDRRAVSGFFRSSVYSRLKNSPNVLREQRFIVRFDDISIDGELEKIYKGTDGMLQGIADCIFEETDGYVLVDYKTDRVGNLADLRDRYALQLSLYKAAFDVLLDKPIRECYIYSFRLGEGIEVF